MSTNVSEIRARVAEELKKRSRSTKFWSTVYHGSLFGSALMSFCAAVILQAGIVPEEKLAKELATVATLASGLCTTIMGAGRFQEKWQTSRLTRSRLEIESLNLMASDPDPNAILEELKRIRRDHDLGVVGGAGRSTATLGPNTPLQPTGSAGG